VRTRRESGVALITVTLVLILVSAMVIGMSWMVMTDQRLGGNNSNRETAFYGAEAGMEKLTADLGNTFASKGSVAASDLTTITGNYPSVPGITFQNASGSTYQILCGSPLASPCTPTSQNSTILSPSPYAGMQGLITQLELSVAAQTINGSEVKLHRQVQLVAIPVFQFGIYSDSDLAFFNGPSFNFGGRVHTNGNLWLAPNSGPLLINDKVTVVGQVIRTNLENGWPGGSTISSGGDYSGIVSISTVENTGTAATSPNYNNSPWLPLTISQSSVTGSSVYGNVSTTPNTSWGSIVSGYNGELKNGVAPLSLTSTALGGITTPISLIRRPVVGEATSNPAVYSQQYYSQVTLRILLDDYAGTQPTNPAGGCHTSDMMSLDGIDTSKDPVDLSTLTSQPTWWSTTTAPFYPLPTSGASGSGGVYALSDGYWIQNGKPILTGCIKIEYQDTSNKFHDITQTILNLGLMGRNVDPEAASTCTGYHCTPPPNTVAPSLVQLPASDSTQINAQGPPAVVTTVGCTDPHTNAIIRLARLRDNPTSATSGGCGTPTTHGYDYWPNALFDTREATFRPADVPNGTTNPLPTASGVMNYIELDAGNLATWFKNNQSSLSLLNSTGFAVYFSDRRGEQPDPALSPAAKTGSYGYNDFANGTSDATHGCPNGALDGGEDLEGDGTLRVYGGTESVPYYALSNLLPSPTGTQTTSVLLADPSFCTSQGNAWPGAVYAQNEDARENPPVFFRHALKVVDGQTLNLGTSCYGAGTNPPCGLTIAAENPVYLQGDYNAPNNGTWSGSSVAASIAADAITFLSDSWNDVNSFITPYDSGSRDASQTAYRVALIGGKGIPFTQPSGQPEDFGTDGGLHNFLRFLENWSGVKCYYDGSLVSFYYNRQGVGTYKGDVNNTYQPPSRQYQFDTNFTQGPQWLPPLTPVLRSINTIGFSQEIMPTQ